MLKNIHIQNYRGIKDLKIKDFKRINLFVGDNDSGKTSVLEALAILKPDFHRFIQIIMLRELGGVFIQEKRVGALPAVVEMAINLKKLEAQFYQRNIAEPFVISADVAGDDRKLKKITLKARLTSEYTKFDQAISTQDQFGDINSFIADYSCGKEIEKLGLSSNGTGKMVGKSFGINHVFISDITPKKNQIHRDFTPIADSSREVEYVEIMKKFEPDLCNIKQVGDDVVFDFTNQKSVSISYMGSGFTRFLSIFLTLDKIGKNPAILCIDEIDNGLHHSKQEHFWKIMFAFLKRYKNLQIFATTHSYEAIAALSRVFEESGKKDLGKDEIRVFQFFKKAKNFTETLDANAVKVMIKNHYEMR